MKYHVCIKYPSGYRYRKTILADSEFDAKVQAEEMAEQKDRSDFSGCFGACKVESVIPEHIPTNADRLRAMSDEELAKLFVSWQKKDPSTLWCRDERGCAALGEDFICTDELEAACIVQWLRQPAQPEDHHA